MHAAPAAPLAAEPNKPGAVLVEAPLAAHARSWFGLEPIDAQQVWFGLGLIDIYGLVWLGYGKLFSGVGWFDATSFIFMGWGSFGSVIEPLAG